ncbi:MAG: DUF4065 domain-containing protein [Bdellovibrionales bacterium]|nr:DUF4065 domain-containing protein [Bdellovibrionales bacterium]
MTNNSGHNPLAIANHFIELNNLDNEKGLSLVKLIKLSYISHGFTLAILDKPLSEQPAEAWKYGPVFPMIYHEFKYHKDIYKITEKAKFPFESKFYESNFNDKEKEIMKVVFNKHQEDSGEKLITLTHEIDGPWHQAWKKGGHFEKNYQIDNEEIKKYYKKKIAQTNVE